MTYPQQPVQQPYVPVPQGASLAPANLPIGSPILFTFDGGAASYIGTLLASWLLTAITLGIAYPWALVMRQRWITSHTLVAGRRLRFTGSGIGLIGQWIKWLLLSIITLGIYLLWVNPRIQRWIAEHTELTL